MTEAWAQFAVGAVLLFAGAEWLARLVGRLVAAAGGGWLVAGPVVRSGVGSVAVLAASLTAAWKASPGIALGCVIGAAVATVGAGLGVAAAGRPLRGQLRLLYTHLPAAMAATAAAWFLSGDGRLDRANGGILIALFVAYVALTGRTVRAETRPGIAPPAGAADRARVLFALLVLAGGAVLMVAAAIDLQGLLGLTEWTTGLTLVAAAAAAPTLVAIVRSGWAAEGDAALFTAAAANTTTLLLVLGVVCVVRPVAVRDPAAFRELPALGMSSLLLLPPLLQGLRVSRAEGAMWAAAYGGLVAWQLGAFRR